MEMVAASGAWFNGKRQVRSNGTGTDEETAHAFCSFSMQPKSNGFLLWHRGYMSCTLASVDGHAETKTILGAQRAQVQGVSTS